MSNPKKKPSKGKKRKITIKSGAKLQKKGTKQNIDTTSAKKAPTIVPSNGVVFKVKVRKK